MPTAKSIFCRKLARRRSLTQVRSSRSCRGIRSTRSARRPSRLRKETCSFEQTRAFIASGNENRRVRVRPDALRHRRRVCERRQRWDVKTGGVNNRDERMRMKARKSWREKLADSKGLPRVGKIEGKMTTRWGTGTMVIPAPVEVDAMMQKV